MFTTGVYNPIPTGYQYPTQPPVPAPVYPTQYNGFYPQTTAPLRGQSVPATNRQYPPNSSRPYGQYPPVPPVTQQTYQSTKSRRKRSKKRTPSPDEIADHSLYSDKEKNERSRSPSPVVQTDNVSTKQEEIHDNEHEQQSQASAEQSQGPTNPPEEQAQAPSPPKEKRKSRSKKKRHHHRHRYEQVDASYVPPPPTQPPSAYFGALPPQMRVHQQPLYTSYNQAYEESIRRGDVYQKQAKRSTRLPPEAKQQLLPHEDDNKKQYLYTNYPQPTYNPYQGNFYSTQAPVYNVPPARPPSQPWPQAPPAEQEIQRLRSHIHTLEGELHKLQKKLTKTTIHHDHHHSPRQTPLIVELNNQPNGSLHLENEGKPSKSSREETAAQLAHAAAAHVNARQQVPAPPPPPPPPPPSSSTAAAGPNYSQQRNYNQSNNNDDVDRKDGDERQRRSADKILDAFERFYMSKSNATPMKVKYIPEDSQTNQQRNTNNNNNDLIRDRSSSLSN